MLESARNGMSLVAPPPCPFCLGDLEIRRSPSGGGVHYYCRSCETSERTAGSTPRTQGSLLWASRRGRIGPLSGMRTRVHKLLRRPTSIGKGS